MAQQNIDFQLETLISSLPATPLTEGPFSFGGANLVARSNSQSALDGFSDLFAHLQTDGFPHGDVFIVETDLEVSLPKELKLGYVSLRFRSFLDFNSQAVVIAARDRKSTYILTRSNFFSFTRPDLARLSAQALFDEGYFALHGALLSWEGGPGILVSAAGGHGKSSTVVSCIRNGAVTAGDDFLMSEIDPEGRVIGHSLFGSVRLSFDSPEFQFASKKSVHEHDGKKIFRINDLVPGSLVEKQRIDALVIPRFSEKSELRQSAKTQALLSIAPSSVALSANKTEVFESIAKMVQMLPCYEIGLSKSGDENAKLLRSLAVG